jgi:crotonobetainyl-CoA:carnitine CoA-transferase CaiB-like acyl-CoA transferase
MATHLEGGPMKPGGQPAGVFQTADGWMTVLAINERDWKALCQAMELPELAADPRFATAQLRLANDIALYAIMRPALAARPWAEWSARFTSARLMHERLNSYADFLAQPHVKESGLIQWLAQAGVDQPVPVPALPGTPVQRDGTPRGTAPLTGQHTAEILLQHGYAQSDVDSLMAKGVVAAA